MGNKPLMGKDLEAIKYGPGDIHKHEQSIAGSRKPEINDDDLRSLRSEFDYTHDITNTTHKKKFTDVLTESQRGQNPNGLKSN